MKYVFIVNLNLINLIRRWFIWICIVCISTEHKIKFMGQTSIELHDVVSRVHSCQKHHRVFLDHCKVVSATSQQEMVLPTH